MRISLKNILKTTLICTVLLTFLNLHTNPCLAAEKSSKPSKVMLLTENIVYNYDLNGDGKTEAVQYKVTEKENAHTATLKLYINKKLVLTKEEEGLSYCVYLTDLNQSDNSLNFFIYTVWESGWVENAFFAQYNESKLDTIAFEPMKVAKDFNISRYTLFSTDGNGKFTLSIDTPIDAPSIGFYYCYISFQLKDNKITLLPDRTFSLVDFSKNYQYKAAKTISAYQSAGSKTVSYKIKKGDTVTFDEMYLSKSGKVYFRMNNAKGKKGWIRSNLNNLFIDVPMWG